MKTKIIIAAVSGALLLSPAANAQFQTQQQGGILQRLLGSVFGANQQASEQTLESDWDQQRRPFEQRRPALEARIDAAVRDGSLSRGEAEDMRREYDDIVDLEARYSANGQISQEQRRDLRMRYRALAQRVGGQGAGQGYAQGNQNNWQPMSARNAEFEQRVAAGLQNRTLTRTEALRLRSDWRALGQVETNYRMGGIDYREQADLQARYDAIDARLGGSIGGGANGNFGGGFGADRDTARWSRMETRLAQVERSGRLDRNEAAQVRLQLSDLARLDAAYATGGYTADERSYLTRRYGDLDQMLGSNMR